MIAHLRIAGLGPCADLDIDLDPVGVTTITGPSMVGKSTLIRASTWALLGVDVDGSPLDVRAIDDTLDDANNYTVTRAEVALTTKSGTVITRTVTRSRSGTRKIEKGGAVAEYGNEEQFARALGAVASTIPVLQSHEHAARLVMVPFGWVSLTHQKGRALRDLLGQLVPGDHRAEVAKLMGCALGKDDPIDEKGAVALRKTANAERDTAQGALREAKAAHEALVEPVALGDTLEAEGVLSASRAWVDFEADAKTHAVELANRETRAADRAKAKSTREADFQAALARANETQAEWDRRKVALGEPVKHPVEPPRTKDREALDGLNTRIAVLTATTSTPGPAAARAEALRGDLGAAVSKLAELERAGEVCPTCNRDGWRDAAKALGAASDAVIAIREQLAIAEDEAKTEHEAAETKRANDLADAEGEREKLRARVAEQDAAGARYHAELSAWEAYDKARQALGDRPGTPVPPKDDDTDTDTDANVIDVVEPVMPQVKRPTADEIATAKATIDAATKAEGARSEYDRAKRVAETRVKNATTEAESKGKRAAYLDRLVDAVRKAPLERAARQAEVLGDLGPVSFDVTADGAEVLFDGRPWWLASYGRRIVCDLWLRAALRRATKLPFAPLFVDDSQSWTGEWPSPAQVPGPLVFLVTQPGEFTVEFARRAA